MRKNIFIYLAVLFVILSLQCTGILTTSGGSEKTQIQETDLLRINYLDISPSTVLHPGDKIFVRMEVENIGQENVAVFINTTDGNCDDDTLREIKENGMLLLYSVCAPLYTIDEFRILSNTIGRATKISADINYDGKPENICALNLEPDETAVFYWKLSTPTKEELFGMIHQCTFRFRVMYKSKAKTTAYVYFASPNELAQRIYTRDELSMAGNNIATFGPVVAMVTAEDQPYPAGSSFTLPVTMENRGKGIAEVLNLRISYPSSFSVNEERCELFEDTTGNAIRLKSSYDTKDMLKIYGGKSSRFYCEFNTSGVEILTPYRFDVEADYLYSIFEEKEIKVVPYEKD
jgi:hypothetical protein